MGRKAAWSALVVGVLLVVAVVAAGLALVRPWVADHPVTLPPPAPEPPPPAVLPVVAGDAPAPTPDGVREAVEELLEDAPHGGRISAAVVDLGSGDRLYEHDAGVPTVPASTTKLVTASTVLATHDPGHRLHTVAVAGAEPGEVVLVGGGDPTLAVDGDGFYPGAARLDDLADQVRESLGEQAVATVTVDTSLFTGPVHGPWEDDIPDSGFVGPVTALQTDGARVDPDPAQGQQASLRHSEPALVTGEAFAELLDAPSADVSSGEAPAGPAGASPSPAETAPATAAPAGGAPADPTVPGTQLGRVSSPPLVRLVELMLESSDNVLAEALARQVALARGEPASFEGAATAMTGVLDELGVSLSGGALADGSGLSRENRFPAGMLVDLLVAAAGPEPVPALSAVVAGLPVAAWSGTLETRYRQSDDDTGSEDEDAPAGPGAGVVRAKTGSLTGVNALAGVVVTEDGRLLGFAFLTEDVPVAPGPARAALDEVAGALAECGCR